ncbi:MAG: hypothetical protein AB4058_06725 [Microcystaceae cyanobacterium]
MSSLFRSLLLSVLLSFATPCLLVILVLFVFLTLTCVPDIAYIGQSGIESIKAFLVIFGSGYPLQGMMIIAMACSTVGGLFDLYNFYIYQGVKVEEM